MFQKAKASPLAKTKASPVAKTKASEKKKRPASPKKKGGRSSPGKLCRVEDLLKANVIKTGLRNLRVERNGKQFFGDLNRDGTIDFSTCNKPTLSKSFPSPSAFSNFCCKVFTLPPSLFPWGDTPFLFPLTIPYTYTYMYIHMHTSHAHT